MKVSDAGTFLLFVLASAVAEPTGAQARPSGPSGAASLELFGERMVGAWEDETSRHVFTWGVGRKVVHSRSYAADQDGWTPVSEGLWYGDPATALVRGRVVATGMGIDLLEYTTRVTEDRIVHDLVAHGARGGTFVERWTFTRYGCRWSLQSDGDALMEGVFRRVYGP